MIKQWLISRVEVHSCVLGGGGANSAVDLGLLLPITALSSIWQIVVREKILRKGNFSFSFTRKYTEKKKRIILPFLRISVKSVV